MKVAVITPYHEMPLEWLQTCVNSVQKQSYQDCFHILVGDGVDRAEIKSSSRLCKISLTHNIGDFGDSPRSLGAIYAFSLGADAVVFLDSDNWMKPHHIESLVKRHKQTGAWMVCSYRDLVSLDGQFIGFDHESDAIQFCDTNCMFFHKKAEDVAVSWWKIPSHHHAIDDRIIWDKALRSRFPIARTEDASVVYRTGFIHHYLMHNKKPHRDAKTGKHIRDLYSTLISLQKRAKRLSKNVVLGLNQK